jgi:TRAP-type mannitol/chloroaromatic compound transport system permease small subunit
MSYLLAFSRFVDAFNQRVGIVTCWMILLCTLISAGNALMRYAFNYSSNGYLEIQWYLFSVVFLLAAAWTLKEGAHVRIDLLAGKLPVRVQAYIDIFGSSCMLIPVSLVIVYYGWTAFMSSWGGQTQWLAGFIPWPVQPEYSSDAGGLIRWPVKLLVPVAFAMLIAQGLSEIIKRVAFLKGLVEWHPGGHNTNAPASAGGQ